MAFVYFFILFFLGASLGSFLYATALRLVSGEGFKRQRSQCASCRAILRWYQLIPVVSYVALGGRCFACKARFSFEYFVSELVMGGYILLLGYSIFFSQSFAASFAADSLGAKSDGLLFFLYAVLGSALFVIFVVDLKTLFIVMPLVRALIVLGIIVLLFSGLSGPVPVWASEARMILTLALIIAAGFFLIWAGTKGRGMGYGDIELSFLLSLFLPYPLALIMVLASFWTGAVVGIGLMAAKGYQLKSRVPFGPFLILGFIIALFWGDVLMVRLLPLP